ncbi:MAG: hypothetical protein WA053_01400 [Minisyncoccia bacterium]
MTREGEIMATCANNKYYLSRKTVLEASEKDTLQTFNENPKALVTYVAEALEKNRLIPCAHIVQLSKMVDVPLESNGVVLDKLSEMGFVQPIRFSNIREVLEQSRKFTG